MADKDTPRLLSVEDNSETRLLLKHLLGSSYDVTFASSYEEALEAIDAVKSFDLYLLDINLKSEKSGTELLQEIRSREDVDYAPAIALTAYAMPGDREALLQKGFSEYVSKPFTGTELKETIDEVLNNAVGKQK